MITQPFLIFLFLISIEIFILYIAAHRRTKHLFKFLPSIFWIYFLPMLASSFGLIDSKSPLYSTATNILLPASLFLVLLGVDLKAIFRLGHTALFMFLIGCAGIMIGTVVSFALFQPLIEAKFWSGFGALSASWMGGSANMLAVKEALSTPDDVFPLMIIVDTIVPYSWMGLLIAISKWQSAIDKFNKADRNLLEDVRRRIARVGETHQIKMQWKPILLILIIAFTVSNMLQLFSARLPVIEGVITPFTWTIILVSLIGLACSLTPLHRFELSGSSKAGYYMLYFVLTTIGAKASIANWGESFALIAAGIVIILIHGIILFFAARILKAPIMFAAAASQACVGGVISAPVVAEIYQPGLAALGLLMAILGNIIGTYLGIITGQLCRWVAGIG